MRLFQWQSHESVLTSFLLLSTVVYLTLNNQTCYLGQGKNIAHFLFSILASMSMIQVSEHRLMLNKPKKQMFIATQNIIIHLLQSQRMYKGDCGNSGTRKSPQGKQQLTKRNGVEGHRKGSNCPQAKPLVLKWRLVWPQRDSWQCLETL